MARNTRESAVVASVRLEAIDGVVVWVNRVGFAVPSRMTHAIWHGLPRGSGDLIGLCDGRFISIEIKRPGRDTTAPYRRRQQEQWRQLVRKFGGFATVVRSVSEYRAAIERCKKGDSE